MKYDSFIDIGGAKEIENWKVFGVHMPVITIILTLYS